jgi:type IV pilus assembly protein PilX
MMTHTNPRKTKSHKQRGAILVTCLLLLLTLTIVGITTMQMTRLQERMAGNTRDMNLALQGSEAALRDGEAYLRRLVSAPTPSSALPCNAAIEDVCDPSALPDLSTQDNDWWDDNALELDADGDRTNGDTQDAAELAVDPRFVIEALTFIPDSPAVGHEVPTGRDFYRLTGRSTGGTGDANVVLQSTFTRRF